MAIPEAPARPDLPQLVEPPDEPQSPAAALWRTREYLRPYYGALAIMLATALLAMATEIAIPLLTKAAIDGPISAAARGSGRHGYGTLIAIGIGAIALGLVQGLLNLYRRWAQAGAIIQMERAMRDDLYAHLQKLEPSFHDAWQSGQLLSRATTDLSAIRRFAGFGVIFGITNLATFAVVITLLIRLDPLLGSLTALVFIPVAALCLRFERRYSVLSRRVQDQQDDLATDVEEAATGIRILKAFGRAAEAQERHFELATRVYQTQVEKARLRGIWWASLDLVPNLLIVVILLLGALAVSHGRLTIGGLVAFIALVLQLVWPIMATGYILALGQEAATAAQRVYEIFDTKPQIASPALVVPRQRVADSAGTARLVLDHVEFAYQGASEPVLRDVCLELAAGETVALVGATGSGKTTLLHLIARLAEATGGSIRLDGVNITELTLPDLRTAVGCAFEDPTLFSVSVRENVSLGAPGASQAQVEAALAAAQADFVADLPWGLETRIGEQGMSLSGGQRQRLALARAILAAPEVLLLDDPLSALDVHTEAKVTAALSQALADTTALIVAHRPSTVALADRVVVLQDGAIVASGTHHNLLAANAVYRHLMSADETEGPA